MYTVTVDYTENKFNVGVICPLMSQLQNNNTIHLGTGEWVENLHIPQDFCQVNGISQHKASEQKVHTDKRKPFINSFICSHMAE